MAVIRAPCYRSNAYEKKPACPDAVADPAGPQCKPSRAKVGWFSPICVGSGCLITEPVLDRALLARSTWGHRRPCSCWSREHGMRLLFSGRQRVRQPARKSPLCDCGRTLSTASDLGQLDCDRARAGQHFCLRRTMSRRIPLRAVGCDELRPDTHAPAMAAIALRQTRRVRLKFAAAVQNGRVVFPAARADGGGIPGLQALIRDWPPC